MPTEMMFDGRTVYTSTRRVVLYASLREIKLGCRKHGYNITAKRLRELASLCGEVAGLNVFMTPTEFDIQTCGLWMAEGFRIQMELPDKISLKGRTTLIKAPAFQGPMQSLVENDAANLRPDAVIFVATDKVPPDLIGTLKVRGVKVIFLSPKQDSFSARGADELIFLRDVCDGHPLPRSLFAEENDVPESGVRTVFVPRRVQDDSIWNRLQLSDSAVCEQLEHLLTLKPDDVDKMLRNLEHLAKRDELPHLTLAMLFALSGYKRADAQGEEVNKNRLWHLLLNYNIDAHCFGNLALKLLTAEGTLCAYEERDEVRYFYVRDPEDPSHKTARIFCSKIILLRGRVVMQNGESNFSDELLQALEIFRVNPADLTPKAKRDLMDWLLLLMRSLDNDARLTAYARLGLYPHDAIALERQAHAIIRGPSGSEEDDDEDEEEGTGNKNADDTPST
ncbi:hypothetical protein KKD88_01400, partial [Patescibacteria group bacterium]|nr:hypothetical protein [Patescibacteria group bacterium]